MSTQAARGWRTALAAAATGLLAACQTPADPPPHGDIVRRQLTLVLARHDVPCEAVTAYARNGLLDYRVQCASGHVYRVHVDGSAHVLVTPHDGPAPPGRAASGPG